MPNFGQMTPQHVIYIPCALLVGLIRAGSLVFYPEFEILAIYLIVIAVLLFKPSGLLGKPAA